MLRDAVTDAHSKYTSDVAQPLVWIVRRSRLVDLGRYSRTARRTKSQDHDLGLGSPWRWSRYQSFRKSCAATTRLIQLLLMQKTYQNWIFRILVKNLKNLGFEFAPEYLTQTNAILLHTGSDALVSGVGGDNLFGVYGPPPYWLSQTLRDKGPLELLRILQGKRRTYTVCAISNEK